MKTISTPQEIIALIEDAEKERAKKNEEAKALEIAKADEVRKEREAETTLLLDKVDHLIPDVIFPYLMFGDRTYGDGSAWWERSLEFRIPGLAPIVMVFTDVIRDDEEPKLSHWSVAGVVDLDWDEDTNICKSAGFSFRGNVSSTAKADSTNIRQVLWAAKKVFEEKEDRQIQLDQSIARYHERKQKQAQEATRQASEEEALFDAIKNDPIAVHMLKAFVLLRDERSVFEQRIEEMGDEMYGIEDRWSRKASDLRRQAEDIERRARDEQSRLQSELEDTEERLRKIKRGW